MKRSTQPVFWVLFGAGGMLSALVGFALVFVTGVAGPLHLLPKDLTAYSAVHGFAQNWAGKAFLFVAVSLFLWHGAHRIFHSLHDVGIHSGVLAKLACYGVALLGTLTAAEALLKIGF